MWTFFLLKINYFFVVEDGRKSCTLRSFSIPVNYV
jgi:hypothetical protein